VAARSWSEWFEFTRAANDSAAPEALDLAYRSGIPAATVSEAVFSQGPGAEARGVSERTIANQAQAIYRKLGVRSSKELATNLILRAQ